MSYWVRPAGRQPDWTQDVEVPETMDRLFGILCRAVGFEAEGIKDLANFIIAPTFVETLEAMIGLLGTDPYQDLWAPTPGNLGGLLVRITEVAQEHLGERLEVQHVKTQFSIFHEDSNPY